MLVAIGRRSSSCAKRRKPRLTSRRMRTLHQSPTWSTERAMGHGSAARRVRCMAICVTHVTCMMQVSTHGSGRGIPPVMLGLVVAALLAGTDAPVAFTLHAGPKGGFELSVLEDPRVKLSVSL